MSNKEALGEENENNDYVMFSVNDHQFGLPVMMVKDVLMPSKITKVPHSRREVLGLLNLRGRIVTVINTRMILNADNADSSEGMCIVVEYEGEGYALLVDKVEDVVAFPSNLLEPPPASIFQGWKDMATGMYKTEDGILLIINICHLLGFISKDQAPTIAA